MGVEEASFDRVRGILTAHAAFLSTADEAEILARLGKDFDVGELGLRTCLCGARIDGFDAYWEHLSDMLANERGAS
jgi:hypothetical protein